MKKLYACICAAALALSATVAVNAATPSRSTSAASGVPSVKTLTERPRQMGAAAQRAALRAQEEGILPPFVHSLGKGESITKDSYISINANGDTRSWNIGGFTDYSVIMKPNADDVDANDDWMISPAVQLQAGAEYTYSIDAAIVLSSGSKDLFDICIGTAQEAEGMTLLQACEVTQHKNAEGWQTFTGTFTVEADGLYYFGFHALSTKAESGTLGICNFSVSAPVVKVEGIEPPFSHALLKGQDICNEYTFLDANGDGRSWKIGVTTSYTACMAPNSTDVEAMDDWLFTPALALQGGEDYTLSLDMGFQGSKVKRMLVEVCIGSAPEAMTTVLKTIEIPVKDMATYTAEMTIPATGTYYIGIHAVTPYADCEAGSLKLSSVALKAGIEEKVDLPAAGSLDVAVFPKGELKAHVTYVAPTLTTEGAPLEKIAKVVIVNRWYEKFEYTDVTPGQTIELDVDLFSGMSNNRVEATAYAADSRGNLYAGEAALVTGILGGLDNPLTPQNIKAVLSADRKSVTVSWDAVGEVGENGGYVDPAKVEYYIFDAFGSYYDPALAVTTETSYTFDYSNATEPDFIAYQVTAGMEETYYSLAGNSNILTYGPALKMPFKESFADGYYESVWVSDLNSSRDLMVGTVTDNYLQTNADDPDAEPEYLNSQDGDNGFFYFLPMNKDDLYGLMSLPVSLDGAVNPALEFYAQGKGSVIDVMVGPSIDEMQVVRTIDFMQTPTDGWTLFSTPLTDFIPAGAVNFELRLRAVHNDDEHTWSIPLDNIRVRDILSHNLTVASLTAPATVSTTEPFSITAIVENNGSLASTPAAASLKLGDAEVATAEVPALAPGERAVLSFEQQASVTSPETLAYTLTVDYAPDMLPADNTATATATVNFPAHPAPESLVAEADGSAVKLSWMAPSLEGMTDPVMVEDGFETYDNFAYDSFGDWTCYDLDGAANYTFLGDKYTNPYATMPMAFQVFNAYNAGLSDDTIEYDAKPHSGETMLVSWSCSSYNANVLASPRLSGRAQTITFWAKSFSISYGEEITIYASTTGCAVADFREVPAADIEGEFVTVRGVKCVPEEWTQYSVSLPEGTTHFAILMDSYDTYALYLDDFTFEAAAALPADTQIVGYNVYRDGSKINAEPVAEPMYIDTPDAEGSYAYSVSAVYNNAESRLCPDARVDFTPSGIQAVEADAQQAVYYDLQGMRVAKPQSGQVLIRVTAQGAEKVVF